MGRRKGELTAAAIDRGWPHQAAVPADECRGSHGRFIDAFCLAPSVCERHHSVFHEDKWWIVYCFADVEHTKKFRMRFGGERFIPKDRGRGGTRTFAEHLYCRDVRTVHSQLHVGAEGPRNRHVSGVLLLPETGLWKLREEKRQPVLAVNPWAERQLPDALRRLRRFEADNGRWVLSEGERFANVVGLPDPWPPSENG